MTDRYAKLAAAIANFKPVLRTMDDLAIDNEIISVANEINNKSKWIEALSAEKTLRIEARVRQEPQPEPEPQQQPQQPPLTLRQ